MIIDGILAFFMKNINYNIKNKHYAGKNTSQHKPFLEQGFGKSLQNNTILVIKSYCKC